MRKGVLPWLTSQIRNRIPSLLLLTLAQMGYALLSVLFALGTRGVIDSAVSADQQAFLRACLWQLAIVVGILICLTVSRHWKERLQADLERDWKRKLLHGLLHGDYAKVSAFHSGELLNRLNSDVAKVNEGLLSIFPAFAAMVTRLVAAVWILGVLDSKFTLLILLLGGVVVLATGALRRYLKKLNKQVSACDGKVSGYIQENIENLLMVQSLDVSAEVEHRADGLFNERYQLQRKRKSIGVLANTGVSVMYYGVGFFALVWCAGWIMQGQMSFGSLSAVIQLVNQLQRPFMEVSGVLPQYAAMTASAERLMELETIQGEPIPMEENTEAVYQQMDSLAAEGLTFSYDRERVFHNAAFSLPKGAFAVITGHSGIGKSTLLKLMLGIFRPERGGLYLRGSCGDLPLDRSTRRMFAYVPQGNLLLSGTLRENLTIVKPEASEEEIKQAVYTSTMDTFISQLPQGLDTVLGEGGSGLSEGQAQRLAIARAVLSGAPILLLDECTSALDEETEKTVLMRLKSLPDRTCIAVTHRPAAIALCDWQLKVSDGVICAKKQGALQQKK